MKIMHRDHSIPASANRNMADVPRNQRHVTFFDRWLTRQLLADIGNPPVSFRRLGAGVLIARASLRASSRSFSSSPGT